MSPNDVELRKWQNMVSQQAVCIRGAHKRYGSNKNPLIVLNNLNMTVPKGTMYGLLGASGCGKTTLLGCIGGVKRLNSGDIWVLSGKPCPGTRIGYMPQDIALYGEFTIRETMKYFGLIVGMDLDAIESNLQFLTTFLMLPDADQQVKNLSGGQQRRVSFGAALLHQPELLILDEPTVGVDPILRQNIWDYLVQLTKDGKTTIIITTHYIEEARQAHFVGLMRGGYLLAEEPPEKLMARYGAATLEDVFLKLSIMQNKQTGNGVVNEGAVIEEDISPPAEKFQEHKPAQIEFPKGQKSTNSILNANHMKALIWKNFLWMWRNIPIMVFAFGLPICQIIMFCLSIGRDPQDLHISVVNYELKKGESCVDSLMCNSTQLGCSYLQYLTKLDLDLIYFDNEEDAKESVRKGDSWVTLVIMSNYSDALRNRIDDGRDAGYLEFSDINVYQDISNENIGSFLKRQMYSSFQDFLQDFLDSCEINRKLGILPIRYNDPVYGSKSPKFIDFAAPGLILNIIFSLTVASTSVTILTERNEGILERSLVNGVTNIESLLAHLVTQFFVMSGQTVLLLTFAFAIFNLTINGDIVLVAIITLLTGFCGMCFGCVISCACDSEISATYMSLGSFLPITLLSGILWPIEALHYILQPVGYILPLTKSTESLRSITQRGWGMSMPAVYIGFISTILWIVFYLTLSVLLLKFKKR